MKKFIALLSLVLFFGFNGSAQTKIGGIVMPNVMKVDGEYLKMNGGGVREKYWIDLYVGVLYLENKSSDAEKIMSADEKMAIKLRIVSGMVSNSKLEDAVREGMEKSTKGNMEPYKARLEKLIKEGFGEDVEDGDIFDLVYVPGKGTSLIKNQKTLVTVEGLDFKKAIFGVWLCDEPAQESLKKKMLGN
ncbi:chalcone isomerase family protein [Paracrocinitomix mangrovi]|uniref:chalcone isomerase family protein n=1 Tax=Paracrocinitomix mangrovi TaxID=2862509 RepID=UPI001C8E4C43|nr:chalcone isomerase family protein [Paracrocinitomix mangrovi]UKN01025.1 chalcone isomerase family protein [Paracrocinitomix mangrovi]